MKVCTLHPLYDKLRDSVTSGDFRNFHPIVIDQDHHDLATIAGVDRARGVKHRHAEPGGQARSWVDQADVPVWQLDRDAGRHRVPALPGAISTSWPRAGRRRRHPDARTTAAAGRDRVARSRPVGPHRLVHTASRSVAASRTSRAVPSPVATTRHQRWPTSRPPELAYPRRVAQQSTTAPATYTERLTVPWWWWPVALAVAAFLAAEVFLGAPKPLVWLPVRDLPAGDRHRAGGARPDQGRVAGGELHVDDAHIPVRYLAEVNIIDVEAKRALLGPLADPVRIRDPAAVDPRGGPGRDRRSGRSDAVLADQHPASGGPGRGDRSGRTDAAGSSRRDRAPAASIDAAQRPAPNHRPAWPASKRYRPASVAGPASMTLPPPRAGRRGCGGEGESRPPVQVAGHGRAGEHRPVAGQVAPEPPQQPVAQFLAGARCRAPRPRRRRASSG